MIMTRQRGTTISKKAPKQPSVRKTARTAGDDKRRSMIAEAAYLLAEQRGFEAGRELDDWLRAEQEIDTRQSASA
jgi:hypothetical protein